MKEKPGADGEDELASLRQQNTVLKGLIKKALRESLKLADLPSELRDSKEYVLAAVHAKAVNWYDLPQKWKNDAEIACSAFERERMFLPKKGEEYSRYLPCEYEHVVKWKDLPYHLKMSEEVLFHALRAEVGPRWEDVPIRFLTNNDLLSTAVLYNKISFQDVPYDLQQNHLEIALKGVQ